MISIVMSINSVKLCNIMRMSVLDEVKSPRDQCSYCSLTCMGARRHICKGRGQAQNGPPYGQKSPLHGEKDIIRRKQFPPT